MPPDEPLESTIGAAGSDAAAPAAVRRADAEQPRADYPSLELISPDHYVLGDMLAHGGMGRVTRARDRRLGREVAIKSLVRNDPHLAVRLEREARITARLHHPAIVTVHEAGVWPNQEPFYAMELVAGRRLGEAIDRTRSLADRLALLPHAIAVADALAYAHAQRIIHRDLKPSNVLVGEFGETVVIDWGLAKDLGDTDELPSVDPHLPRAGHTIAGAVLGTPTYMPPEQAAGAAVDERADVYAIGAILYHLLSGRPPYEGESAERVLAAVQQAPPPPLGDLSPAAPSDLLTIVEKAMQRDPARRYPSARELADDLRKFQTGQLVGSHRYTWWQLTQRWLRRHRAAVGIAVLLLAVLAIVLVVSVRRIIRERAYAEDQQHAAEAQQKRAEDNAQRADRLSHDLEAELGRLEAEQEARSRAETEARAKSSEVAMTKEQLQVALEQARHEAAAADQARLLAEQESQKAHDAEQRAEEAAAKEKQLREAAEQALKGAKGQVITNSLPR